MSYVSPLELDGDTIKLRLMANRQSYTGAVHVDWLRCTFLVRNAPVPQGDNLFPVLEHDAHGIPLKAFAEFPESFLPDPVRRARIMQLLADVDGPMVYPLTQAYEIAEHVCSILGPDFSVAPELRPGLDFYAHRWAIVRAGHECAWVGFWSSKASPSAENQRETIHLNMFGHACTFAAPGWRDKLADYIDTHESARITRVDFALDMFDGLPGSRTMNDVVSDYKTGLLNVNGKQPKCDFMGDWANNHSRSFYWGSKGTGKQTNLYEKGQQLYGQQSDSRWVRCEIRYGNKSRVLPTDVLRRPDDFFAGSSDYHAALLAAVAKAPQTPQNLPVTPKLPLQTVAAEVSRNLRWALNAARPTLSTLWAYLDPSSLTEYLEGFAQRPGRLKKFAESDLRAAFSQFSLGAGVMSPSPAFA